MASWFFPKLGGGEEQGLNDAGVETFRKQDSLARETCQNIGDAWNQESGEPAIATFELVQLPANEFPGRDELIQVFEAARDHVLEGLPDGTGNEAKFFDNALNMLRGEYIPMLRISDENTSGLIGSDDDRRKPFFRLLKGQGASSLQGDGGGTFGIGQRAPFAHSALRTVFYSTRTPEGVAFIAKSILASFPHPCDGQMCQSKGWWCKENDSGDKWSTIRDPGAIPERFSREKIGTDLWVAGFETEDWDQWIRHSVLRHFFAAIENDQLVVQLCQNGEKISEINSSNLDTELEKAAEEARVTLPKHEYVTGLGSTLYFHKAITKPYGGEPFIKAIPLLGNVKLYLYRDTQNKDMPDRWATMRKPRIIVEHFGSGILNRFAAVLLCDTEKGNKYLSMLEGPEHNRWHQEETRQWTRREKEEAREVLSEIRRFVRDTLRQVRGESMTEQQDIPFLGRYLPAENDTDKEPASGVAATSSGIESDEESGVRRSKSKSEKVTGKARKESRPEIREIEDGPRSKPDTDPRPKPDTDPRPKPETDPRPKPGADPRPGPGTTPDPDDDKVQTLSPRHVRFRAYRSDHGYKIVLQSDNEVSGNLKLKAVGEAGTFEVDLLNAIDESNSESLEVKPSMISGISLQAGTKKILSILIDSDSDLVLAMGG
jgi:hypothetical protein